jgi:ABC-type polar amino acid transport system ATPase subunit
MRDRRNLLTILAFGATACRDRRCACLRPHLMLVDEPTSALDPALVGEVVDVLTEVAPHGLTVIVVTHGSVRPRGRRARSSDGQGPHCRDRPGDKALSTPQNPRTRIS